MSASAVENNAQPSRTLEDWLAAILAERTAPLDRTLSRMKTMIEKLGIHFDCPVLTVAGTNGKGSTCAYLEAVLCAGGMKTAMHTSPHLLRFSERCRINGEPVADDVLAQAIAEVDAAREGPLTYFEETGLAILLVMMRAKPEAVVLEIGVGARFDAVNAVDPTGSIITTVDLDHTAWLGSTREAVGAEKAWVYRAGRPAVCADPRPPESVKAHAAAIGAELYLCGRDYGFEVFPGGAWRWHFGAETLDGLPKPALFGSAQYRNAAGALALLFAVRAAGAPLRFDRAAVEKALLSVKLPGRFETVAEKPCPIIIDVAHNPEAARQLVHNLEEAAQPGVRTLAVFAMLGDKDRAEVVRTATPQIDEWFVSGLGGERGTTTEDNTALLLAAGVPSRAVHSMQTVASSLESACAAAQKLLSAEPGRAVRIVAFGSFHTAEEAIKALQRLPSTPAYGRP